MTKQNERSLLYFIVQFWNIKEASNSTLEQRSNYND